MGGARVIADSSVLIVFARAERLDILYRTVGKVGITREVREEAIDAAPHRPDAQALARLLERGRLRVVPVRPERVATLRRSYPNLGGGEASTIAACLQHREKTVLLDERVARRAAALEGLEPVGTLGVLARARRVGVIKSNQELGGALRGVLSAGLWVAPEVVEAFWDAVGARP